MCLSCACGKPNESHGDTRHITQQMLNQAAQAAKITPEQAAQNIAKGVQAGASGSPGQQRHA